MIGADRTQRRTRRAAAVAVAAALCFVRTAAAQVGVRMALAHATVLQGEPVRIVVSIANDSDDPLVVNARADGAGCRVDVTVSRDGVERLPRRADEPFAASLQVPPDETRDVSGDLLRWYDLRTMGRYFAWAEVARNGMTFRSPKAVFEIVRGMELTSVERASPRGGGALRRYTLRYWVRDRTERLFLRVEEPEEDMDFGAFEIGRLLRVHAPTLEVDRRGRVLVVYQAGQNCFGRAVFQSDPDAVRHIAQTYHRADGTPYPGVAGDGAPPPSSPTNAPPGS